MSINLSQLEGLALGTWQFGNRGWGKTFTQQEINELVTHAYEGGMRVFDTAPAYGLGTAETFLGHALKPFREDICLVTKCGLVWDDRGRFEKDNRPEILKRDIDQSLKRLQTDYVDVLLVHWPDENTPDESVLSTLKEIQDSGKVREVGLSNWAHERIKQCLESDIVKISWLQDVCNLLQPLPKSYYKVAYDHPVTTMGYSPLAQGILTGKYKTFPKIGKNDFRRFNPLFENPELFQNAQDFMNNLKTNLPKQTENMTHFSLRFVLDQCHLAVVGVKNMQQLTEILEVS